MNNNRKFNLPDGKESVFDCKQQAVRAVRLSGNDLLLELYKFYKYLLYLITNFKFSKIYRAKGTEIVK